jgi:hypothetical protein
LADVLSSVQHSLAIRTRPPTNQTDADVGLRVAASVGFLGLAARLVSPALGVVAASGVLPELGWSDLCWRRGPGAQLSLAAADVRGHPVAGPDATVGSVGVSAVLRVAIRPVLDLGLVVADRYRVSRQIIRGNVASAVFGAASVIASSAAAKADRRIGERAGRLAADLLARPALSGAGSIDPSAGFRRRSCCLLYRVPGTQLCGDCILRSR